MAVFRKTESHPELDTSHPERSEGSHPEMEDEPTIPWHFWIAVVLIGLYLGYRFIQLLVLAGRAIF